MWDQLHRQFDSSENIPHVEVLQTSVSSGFGKQRGCSKLYWASCYTWRLSAWPLAVACGANVSRNLLDKPKLTKHVRVFEDGQRACTFQSAWLCQKMQPGLAEQQHWWHHVAAGWLTPGPGLTFRASWSYMQAHDWQLPRVKSVLYECIGCHA